MERASWCNILAFSIRPKMRELMKKYTQLTEVQRYQIEALKKAKKEQKDIAVIIGVSASTISREIRRNRGLRGYRPKQAHTKALIRRREAAKAIKMTAEVIDFIETKIQLDWSPEQVSGWLRLERNLILSHERIYQHVWADKRQGGDLYKHLRQSNKKRKKQYGSKDKRGQNRNRISIDKRPEIVERKTRIGDWEIDTVIDRIVSNGNVSIREV